MYEKIKKLDESVTEIEYLSGYPIEELRNKLAAGWTLTPPNDFKEDPHARRLRQYESEKELEAAQRRVRLGMIRKW